jgi:polysaccharide biosynthesis/export protein
MTALFRAAVWVAILGLVVSACSTVPGNGPAGRDIVAAAADPNAQFALVEINDPVLAEMARWPDTSLYAHFGDYRGPVLQRIGIGDAVGVTIWEAGAGGLFSSPALTAGTTGSRSAQIPPQVVAQDGSITVPYAGRVGVAGKTPHEVEQAIVERLQGKAIQPQALVTVAADVSNTATVTGEVVKGARVSLSGRGDRILDVIAEAGGVQSPIHDSFINLERGRTSVRVAMQRLIRDPRENIFVRPGDLLTVVNDPQTFTAAGATGANAVVPFDANGITLDQAIAKAGGLIDSSADPRNVFVLRFEPSAHVRNFPGVSPNLLQADVVPVAYHIDLRQPKALFAAKLFPIRNKDIVYVSDSPTWELQKLANLFSTLTTSATSLSSTRFYVQN